MPRYIEPGEMEPVFWMVEYSDGSYLAKYEPEPETGRWVSHTFAEIDIRRVRRVNIMARDPRGVVIRPIFGFPFFPEAMKLILFYRTEIDMDRDGVEMGRRRWLFYGFQINHGGRGYKVLWASDGREIRIGDDTRQGLPLTPGGKSG